MSTTRERGKYVPTTDGLTREFFTRAHDGTLHLQRCAGCRTFHHPPVWRCASCGSLEHHWVPVPGEGALFSWTVSHRPFDPAWAADAPWITAVVELDEGPRLVGHLAGADPDELAVGRRIAVIPEAVDEGFAFLRMKLLPG
jgi:uncharacterized protein